MTLLPCDECKLDSFHCDNCYGDPKEGCIRCGDRAVQLELGICDDCWEIEKEYDLSHEDDFDMDRRE